jgi:hypothetical protein
MPGLGIKIPRNALAKAAKEYAENPNAGQDAQLEPGTYLGVIKAMRGVETTKGPQIVMDVIVGGDCDESVKGGKVTLWYSLEEDRIIHLFRSLTNLGYDVDDLDEAKLTAIATEIKEASHVVRLKATTSKDGEYVNVRINKVMTDMDASEVLDGTASVDDTEGSAADEEAGKKGAGTDKGKKSKAKEEPAEEEEGEEDETGDEEPEAEEEPKAKKTKGKKTPEPEPEESEEAEAEPEEEAEEEKELKVGTKGTIKVKGVTHKIVVISIDFDEGKAIVKSSTDGKKYKVDPSKIE